NLSGPLIQNIAGVASAKACSRASFSQGISMVISSSAFALMNPLRLSPGQVAEESFCGVSLTAKRWVAKDWLRPRLRHFLICTISSSELNSSGSFARMFCFSEESWGFSGMKGGRVWLAERLSIGGSPPNFRAPMDFLRSLQAVPAKRMQPLQPADEVLDQNNC